MYESILTTENQRGMVVCMKCSSSSESEWLARMYEIALVSENHKDIVVCMEMCLL